MTAPFNVVAARKALQALLHAHRQTNRLLRLTFPRDDDPASLLVADTLDAVEGVSRDFEYKVGVLSDAPDIALKDVLGKMVTLELVHDDGTVRYFNGYVFDFRFIRNDAGFSFYAMVLRPWLAFLAYRQDNALFHGQTVEAQTAALFGRYAQRDWKTLSLGEDPPMTDACQWDESDYNYLHRRWEARGWHYHYEHRKDGHTLVLSGDSTQSESIDGDGAISWQNPSGVQKCGITQFSPARAVASTRYAASSFDFKNPRTLHSDIPTINVQGDIPPLEVHEYAGAYGFKTTDDGGAWVRLRMEEIEARAKHFDARGNDGHAQPGRTFTLIGHHDLAIPGQDAGDHTFLILTVHHTASNNYATGAGAPADYNNTFTCLRKKIPWRPGRHFNSRPSKIYGLQTATVVGPAGEAIHTDEHGRVRVQFHWDREGGYDETSSAWVRVASTFAGDRYGQVALPRAGQEVLVQWLDGNPDRPLITGRVYNASNLPPRFGHTGSLPGEKAVSGWSTQEIGGARLQQLRFDDTPGQISAQLASDHAHSQLNLGDLRHPRNDGRAVPRGEGAELRSDGPVAMRGGEGVLITSTAGRHANHTQLERGELIGLAQTLQSIVEQLGELAATHHTGGTDPARFRQLVKHLQDWEQGTNTAPDQGPGRAPIVAISAAAGAGIVSQDNLVLGAQTHIDAVSAGHIQLTAGQQIRQRAAAGVSTFAHRGGIQSMAGQGSIDLQAHQGNINLTASDTLTLTAGVKIILQAPEVQIIGQGAQTTWRGDTIVEEAGSAFVVKSPSFAQSAGGGGMPAGVEMPTSDLKTDESYVIRLRNAGAPVANRRYLIELDNGPSVAGRSDAHGRTQLAQADAMHITGVTLFDD